MLCAPHHERWFDARRGNKGLWAGCELNEAEELVSNALRERKGGNQSDGSMPPFTLSVQQIVALVQ
jgi:hypothetical protein